VGEKLTKRFAIVLGALVVAWPAVSPAAPAPGSRTLVGVGNVPGCVFGANPGRYLRRYRAQVLRVIVNPRYGASGSGVPCAKAAVAAGFRVQLVIQFWNRWTPRRDAAFAASVLSRYAPYAWAVSIGNEQELTINPNVVPRTRGGGLTGTQYAVLWRAVEPVVARMAPAAIRVAGEISPWGLSNLRAALAAGLPHVQALAVHPYRAPGGLRVSLALALARRARLPLWLTEALNRPGTGAPVGAVRPRDDGRGPRRRVAEARRLSRNGYWPDPCLTPAAGSRGRQRRCRTPHSPPRPACSARHPRDTAVARRRG
jgi:hypothetical protein